MPPLSYCGTMTVRLAGLTVDWLGYATLRMTDGETVVYVDPGRHGVLSGQWEPHADGIGHPPSQDYRKQDGDVVCVSHVHHYDPDGIERVATEDATVVAFESIAGLDVDHDLRAIHDLPYEIREVGMKDTLSVTGADIWTTPAYNRPEGPHIHPDGTPYHPEGFGCGFLVELDGRSVFWPGDTDVLPGHRTLEVMLLCPPIGGSGRTMDQHEAAALAAEIEPTLVLPIHYNTFSNLEADARTFAADVAEAGVPVVLDES
ncbi:L-ascorbate metabolism protein UlaG, beta-lactamase superfamily [Halorientalis regularis]|jgi:L-ascorbate metabolism protein UlaG (beta-lactamase superfamily)|uniref:L-ascorbate metabolism protein UlaG, beta-lactamase superfamily n=2 Tax=Halorientalis regularis TaxID=660518 RepID=A0A1G7FAJ0_9EURY|nr:L-ascorbate metabolism protein UlaG, beta-lactamase superfamily [Halorientalis regularis]